MTAKSETPFIVVVSVVSIVIFVTAIACTYIIRIVQQDLHPNLPPAKRAVSVVASASGVSLKMPQMSFRNLSYESDLEGT